MNIHRTEFGQGEPVLFFHGFGFDSHIWLPLVPLLSARYKLILVDLPGFGRSAMMPWSDFKTHLLADLPFEFSLVGWSMGGLYANRLALEAPHRVKTTVSVCSSPCFLANKDWPGVSKEALTRFHQRMTLDAQGTLKEFIALQIKDAPFFSCGEPPSKEGLEAGLESLSSWDFRDALKTLQSPACFLFGRLDPITPVKTMQSMEILYPKFHYQLFNQSAHLPFLSETELFIDTLLGCIRS